MAKEMVGKNTKTQGTPIDFKEECLNNERGELRCYPLDDTVIMAYDVKVEELRKYMGEDYASYHWSVILKEILNERKKTISA